MSSKRNSEKSKLRMDDYAKDKNGRHQGVTNVRREIDKVIRKARRDDGAQSAYWTKKLLEAEEKEPDRWHHSGFKELYLDNGNENNDSQKASTTSTVTDVAKKRAPMYSPSAPSSPIAYRSSRRSSSDGRRNRRSASSPDQRHDSPRTRTDKFSNSSARQRPSMSPYRRRSKSSRRMTHSPPLRRISRSPIRRKRSPATANRHNRSRSRSGGGGGGKKSSPVRRAAKSPQRSARSPLVVRHQKSDKVERRNRPNEKLLPVRRKKSPKMQPRYRSPGNAKGGGTGGKSPTRRRSLKRRSRSPPPVIASKAAKRKVAHRTKKYRHSSSSDSRGSSSSPVRKKGSRLSSDGLSSSDCSDSNCSMCKFEKTTKEKHVPKSDAEKSKRAPPPPEPKLRPRAALPHLPPTSSSRYARSRSLSVPTVSSPINEYRIEPKVKKKSKKEKKKSAVKASKAITTSIIHHTKIKVESPSDESESPSPKRITLSERFGKMAKWNQKKEVVEPSQHNIRVTAGDNYRVEELDAPLLEPFPEPSPLLLEGSWDDVRVRYAYYKDHGYLEDLSFQDYLKWEEWWYSYQEWLETERLHNLRRRL